MNITSFPNKPQCPCGEHQEGWIIFLKAWGCILGVLSTLAGIGYGGFRLVMFLGEHFGLWLTIGAISIIGLSAGMGLIFSNDVISEQERQKRDCKTHNV